MLEKKPLPLVKLLPDLIAESFHLPVTEGKLRITEEQTQATCRWVEIKMKQSVPSFCFSIDKPRQKIVQRINGINGLRINLVQRVHFIPGFVRRKFQFNA